MPVISLYSCLDMICRRHINQEPISPLNKKGEVLVNACGANVYLLDLQMLGIVLVHNESDTDYSFHSFYKNKN